MNPELEKLARHRLSRANAAFSEGDHLLNANAYISFGKPKPAVGVDVGEGVIVRYDEKAREVIGLTLIGVGKRMKEYIRKSS